MKKFIYILLAAAATFTACKKDESAKINDVTIQVLVNGEPATETVEVTVTDKSTSTAYTASTVNGTASLQLVAGIYGFGHSLQGVQHLQRHQLSCHRG